MPVGALADFEDGTMRAMDSLDTLATLRDETLQISHNLLNYPRHSRLQMDGRVP